MPTHRTPYAAAWQEPRPLDPSSFDKSIAAVRLHPDLTLATRAVHAACVSLHNLGRLGDVTQREIAEWAQVGLRSVVRAMKQLAAAGFLLIRRRGQGLPNAYELVGPGSAKRARLALPDGRTVQPWSPGIKNPGRRIDRDTSHSGYDVAAYLAHEQATYSEASRRYGVRR
jgi:hypothetical protein